MLSIKQAVVFCILMENGNGIVDKAPSYILEKLKFCESPSNEAFLNSVLDSKNESKLKIYEERWLKK